MKTIRNILMVALGVLALSSCVTKELVPEPTTKSVSFAKKTISIAKAGDTQVVAVNANTDWTLHTEAEWVKLAPASGTSATKSITVTVDEENNTDDVRVAEVIIVSSLDATQSDTLTVSQSNVEGVGKIVDADSFIAFLENAQSVTEGDIVEIGADIDLGGAAITPAASFAGILEGNGYKVYNFVIESTFSGAAIIVENKGTVQNLKIGTKDGSSWDKTSVIKFADDVVANAAGSVAAVNSGLIDNVQNYASVDINVTTNGTDDSGVGGIAGTFGGPKAKITNCHNFGAVSFTGTMGYRAAVGGILGFSLQAGTEVASCVNHADLNQATKNAKEFSLGGVVGRANDKLIISDCVNEASVSYTSTVAPGSYLHIAGIIAAAYKGCEVSNCVNKGAISSCIAQVNRMGGIVGTMNSGGNITGCRNEASLTLEQEPNANWQSVGGICGFEEKCALVNEEPNGKITDCTNNGKIKVSINNTTTHANQTAAAGIIGITCSYTTITGNTNNAEVAMTNAGSAVTRAGGIVGWDKTIATVLTGNTNNGNVSATGLAGGIAGGTDVAASIVKDNTNLGTITGATAGSIAGNADCALTSCAVGGTVNGTVLTAGNFSSYIQGTGNGAPVACYFPGAVVQDYISAAPTTLNYVAAGESKTVTVSSNCAWKAVSSESWLTVSDAEGQNESSVTLVAAENTTYAERTAKVTFTSKTDASVTAVVTVSQAAKVDGLAGNKISSAADLKTFLAIAADAQASDVYTLEADVDFSSETLVPATSFAGTLDGKGHTIKLNVTNNDCGKLALIQTLTGTVSNLSVAGSIKSTFDGTGEYIASSVAAIVDGGHVSNCTNKAKITSNGTTASVYCYLGGVVGLYKGDGVTILDCVNEGELELLSNTQAIVGGVAAYGQTNSTAPTLRLENCTNRATITINHSGANWDYIGGVVGKMGASSNPFTFFTVKNCHNSGVLNIVKAPKMRGGAVFGSCGVSSDYEVSGCSFTGTVNITSTEAVDRIMAGVGPGFSEAAAKGKVSNCTFDGVINAVDGGNLYLSGIYGNNGDASVVIDGCKTTSASKITGYTTAKSVGMIACRPNKDGFTIKNCAIAGTIVDASGMEVVISADNIADWMFKGSATTSSVVLTDNGYNDGK